MVAFGQSRKRRIAVTAGAALLVALGAAGGAGAVQATRPTVEMAPSTPTPIAGIAARTGIVTVRGRVAEVFGDRFVVQDRSGRAMVAAGRETQGRVAVGQQVTVQGRFDDGQLRASYLVDAAGNIAQVGPRGPRPPEGEGPGAPGPGHRGPPPPPPGCGPTPGGPGAVPPPPPPTGAVPAPPPPPVDGVPAPVAAPQPPR